MLRLPSIFAPRVMREVVAIAKSSNLHGNLTSGIRVPHVCLRLGAKTMSNSSKSSAVDTRLVYRLLISLSTCLLLNVPVSAQETNPTPRWEQTIQVFERRDSEEMPPTGAILFVGSSSIVFWRSLAEDMEPLQVINRGFGGSQMFELNMYRDRIVTPYKPRAIVIYEGDNDVAAGKTHDEIMNEYKDFISHIDKTLPEADICIIAVKPSIRREQMWPEMAHVNDSLRTLAESRDDMCYFDIAAPMQEGDAFVRADLFVGDGLHLNAEGYKVWTDVIKPVLMAKYGDEVVDEN